MRFVYVVSSRPYSQFVYLSRFSVMRLQIFSKEQSLALIDKLDFRPDSPKIKEKFRKELDDRLFNTHQDFATNPLLLTIMLMTYELIVLKTILQSSVQKPIWMRNSSYQSLKLTHTITG